MGGGGKKGSAKRRVVDYYMSMHYGFCNGPVDNLLEIRVKDKVAWSGNVTANDVLNIQMPDLFGGNDAEGGVSGWCGVFMGEQDQTVPDDIAAKFGRTEATMPGWRG